MNLKIVIASVVALSAVSLLTSGCGQQEAKLSKQEEKNFKGSAEMSDEAKKRMAEGMQRMAEIQKSNGRSMPPATSAGGGG